MLGRFLSGNFRLRIVVYLGLVTSSAYRSSGSRSNLFVSEPKLQFVDCFRVAAHGGIHSDEDARAELLLREGIEEDETREHRVENFISVVLSIQVELFRLWASLPETARQQRPGPILLLRSERRLLARTRSAE
jgi:hypothetical protein